MFPICFEWGELPGGKFSVKETPREIIIKEEWQDFVTGKNRQKRHTFQKTKEDDRVLDILRCAFDPEIDGFRILVRYGWGDPKLGGYWL